jgi:outer membrane protein OmpA-like peptidoglycan-associated protein/tetratricopeptide (TPR) repeat protein
MKNLFLVLFICSFFFVSAQRKYKDANKSFERMDYSKAKEQYLYFIKKGDSNQVLFERLGDCYYYNVDVDNAVIWYEKLFSNYNEIAPEYFFKYGQALKGAGNKKEGDVFLAKYYNIIKKNEDFDKEKQSFERLSQHISNFKIKNLDINSIYSDFGAYVNMEGNLIYSSTKDTSSLRTHIYKWNNQPFLDFYETDANKESGMTFDKKYDRKLNSKFHEAVVTMSPDEKIIYFTRNDVSNNKLRRDKKGKNNLSIYSAEKIDGVWKNITLLPFNDKNYSFGHPSVSPDGNKLYFVSDMPGTLGQTDVFVVNINKDGSFSTPKNLGSEINTTGRELFPFVTESALYFSSDGHYGFGSLDVFKSEKSLTFQKPINLGNTVNSDKDDFAFNIDEKSNDGFVSSNREGGMGDDDIYKLHRTKLLCEQFLEGLVVEERTGACIANADVVLFSENQNILQETKTDSTGFYRFTQLLDCKKTYLVKASKERYTEDQKELITTSENTLTNFRELQITNLDSLIVANKIVIDPIYFDFDKDYIREDAALELNKVVDVMLLYPNMVIKIESHTDSRGVDSYNLKLSDRRAKSTRDYIISQGIEADRIESAIGYGETRLINNCANGVPCTKEEHELNRRSDFIILER